MPPRADAKSWIIPRARFNKPRLIDARVKAARPEARSGLSTTLRYLYLDEGPRNLPLAYFKAAEPYLDPAETKVARWMKTRTNGSERKRYGTGAILAARTSRFRCSECGHADVRTLQIDHTHGRTHRGSELQCLCANCHQIKTRADDEKKRRTIAGRRVVAPRRARQ